MKNESKNLPELPRGWVWAMLGEICEVNLGKTPHKTQYTSEGRYKIVKFRDLTENGIDFGEADKGFVFENEAVIAQLRELQESDVLVTASAHSSEHIGRKVVYVSNLPKKYDKIFFVGELLCIRDKGYDIEPRTIYYFFISQSGYNSVQSHVRGVHLIASEARQILIPIPPLPEQRRIVARIEELFSRLDAGVEALKKVKAQLKAYRQAVLKQAFKGKLTEEWREAHKGELEPASSLLERIKTECQKNIKGKVKELPPLDTSALPDLPGGWVYSTLDCIVSDAKHSIKRGPFGSAIKKSYFVSSGYKVYQQNNVIYNDFGRGSYFINENKFMEMNDFAIKPGDILMSCSGTVGRIAVVPDGITPGIINQALLKITLHAKIINTQYFVFLLRSQIDSILRETTRGSAMLNISSVKELKQVPLSIAPLLEQRKIVEEIDRRFSQADYLEKTVEQSLKQADRLRQSILKSAFESKLVPQDPNDEPAEKLLERIKVQNTKRAQPSGVRVK